MSSETQPRFNIQEFYQKAVETGAVDKLRKREDEFPFVCRDLEILEAHALTDEPFSQIAKRFGPITRQAVNEAAQRTKRRLFGLFPPEAQALFPSLAPSTEQTPPQISRKGNISTSLPDDCEPWTRRLSVKEVAIRCGYDKISPRKTGLFVETLKKDGIQVFQKTREVSRTSGKKQIQRYYSVNPTDIEQACEAFNQNPNLQPFKRESL